LYAEVQLADLNGTVALELLGIELRALGDTGAVDPADGHYLPGWREASLVTAQPSGTCWLTGGTPEVRAALAEGLRAEGWNLVDSFSALPPGGLAIVWGEPAPRDTFATALAATADLMILIQQGATRPDVRWLLATPGCHIVTGREPRTSLTHLGWTGFARALLNEGLASSCRIVDLDPAALESAAAVVLAEARAEGGDREVAWRQRQRFRLEWRRASLASLGGTVRVSLQSTYLVTGGTRGFGLEIARWLLSEGAGRVVLASRSGVDAPGLRAALDGLGEAASRIEVVKGDIADETFVGSLARRLACDVMPLRGVFHCAVVLEDGLISAQNPERLRRVFRPKVGGALALHRSTQEVPLDWFVCLSSISSVFGNPGQSTYAAANAFLEGLVSYRRRHGLAGTVINFGLIRDTGVARGRSDLEAKLERFGIGAMGTDDALRGLCAALNARIPQLGVFRVDWDRWRRAFPGAAADRRFDPIINLPAGDLAVERGALTQQLQLLDPEKRVEGVVTVLRSHLASGLRTPIEQLVDTANILELGVDSLGMIELVTTINRIFAVQLTSTELLGHPTLRGLAQLILGKLGYSSSDLAVLDTRRAYP
jgi:NAD(P)-dependent dehydrogenase (short-subunit alcohol dehydrogenase family)